MCVRSQQVTSCYSCAPVLLLPLHAMSRNLDLLLKPGDIDDAQVQALLIAHAASARAETAPDSAHALDPEAFRADHVHLWSGWHDTQLVAIGAWQQISPDHGEVKSLHTLAAVRGCGIAGMLLCKLIEEARAIGICRLSLETGSWPYFAPARAFYRRHGFVECGPFGAYQADPNSVFMTRSIVESQP